MSTAPAIAAIIFDFDGLLMDTEGCWFEACRYVCGLYGVTITEEHRLELMRSHLTQYLIDRFGLPAEYPEVRRQLYGKFEELAVNAPLMPGATQAVKSLAERYLLAVGTGSNTAQVAASLTSAGLRRYFQVIVGQDQVTNGKPAPDIFLRAAELLGCEPRHCLVLEDQPKGVAAAKAAGMWCVAVPSPDLPDADYSAANAVISSLEVVGQSSDLSWAQSA